jgi:general secretion pathway protein E/type IV pilus assembly protein PilB
MLLGELLMHFKLITQDQLTIALYEQRISKRLLGEELLYLGFITEKALLSLLALRFDLPILTDNLLTVDTTVLAWISEESARKYQVFPIAVDPLTKHLSIAVAVLPFHSIDDLLNQAAGLTVFLTSQRVIEEAINRYYLQHHVQQLHEELEWGGRPSIDETSIIIRFVNALLNDALRLQASDLHCEPEAAWVTFRYRIDGVLSMPRRLHRRHWSALSVRIKLMSGLDIAETRANQDGRILFNFASREVDCRVSVVPTIHGENIVIRLLVQTPHLFTLDYLGFSSKQQAIIAQVLRRPYGLTLVAGPTGGGKTTTLHCLLRQFDYLTHNIMTLEDPVEYRLPGIRQISLQALAQMDFAQGVRAILRQTPDIILIGEIRDKETAAAAFQAGMTGHRVFASVHAKSAIGAITRLQELGIPNACIAANTVGLIGQRLVRRLCEHCKIPSKHASTWQAVGCAWCRYSGFKGRVVISEAIDFDAKLEARVNAAQSEAQLRLYQQQNGLTLMREDAHEKLQRGVTSYSEVSALLELMQEEKHVI